MQNRFCQNFTSGIPVSADKHIVYTARESLNFSAEFWQPFIDVKVSNESTLICGPLLGIAIEIAKNSKSNLTYMRTLGGKYSENLEMLSKQQTNIFLTPFSPSTYNESEQTELSRSIGDLSMISILSAKQPIDSLFHLLHIFSIEIWICFAVFYFSISSLSSIIDKRLNAFINYLAITLRQSLATLNYDSKTALISLIWLYGTMVLMWAYSGLLLTFLVFSTPYDKIDSIHDLAQKDIKFSVFEDESAFDYMKDPNEPYYQKFLNRCIPEVAPNEAKEDWETRIFDKISKGVYALVSDEPFLDYYFATKLSKYPNLYRSKSSQLVLPYFILLAKHNSKELVHTINRVICCIFESGLYDLWVEDTLERNNDAIKHGIYHVEDETYEHTPIILEKFKNNSKNT